MFYVRYSDLVWPAGMVFFVFVAYCYRIGISGVNNSVLHVFIALYSILNVAIKPVHVSL